MLKDRKYLLKTIVSILRYTHIIILKIKRKETTISNNKINSRRVYSSK